ncbi:DUF2815 family protein [Intestinibacillus massiliensis]|uniref:DUF2815 family protein n=1 Tax=Intestinibacillus massiliensis TaxID=1871029 RepID=UPI000B359512|nr:DUF2815 family protein [Intestinibacillus massiliensis]
MYQNNPTKCLTGEVRLSYANLQQPRSNNGGDPKYSVTLLIPKADVATEADIRAAINTAYENGVRGPWQGKRPQLKYPVIYDGDGLRPSGDAFGEECRGCWVLTASSKQKPQCVHISNVHAELMPQDVYSGMYARVTVNFYPYENSGNRGVGCGLGNVCKTRDGEPLSGRANAESDFTALETTQAVQGSQPPVSPAAQANPATGFQPPIGTAVQINPVTGLPM